jgi:importin subunit alpha-1
LEDGEENVRHWAAIGLRKLLSED